MRVLTGPFEVAGVAGAIARALRRRGHAVELAVRAEPPFGLPYDRLTASPAGRIRTGLSAGLRFDVVHLHFATTWCEYLDAAWWRLAGRPLVVMHYHGDDVRTRDIALSRHPARGRVYDVTPNRDERTTLRRLRLARRLCAAAIVGDLELASYAEPFFDTIYVVPVALELPLPAVPEPAPLPGEGPIVFHAPSHPIIKGTRDIVAALERLAARRPLRIRTVTGVPRRRVLEEIARADVVVDQLNSVTPGVFALEAMALGTPVVAEFEHAALAPVARDTPLVRATAHDLDVRVGQLCDEPERRAELGERGRAFVARVHDADVIAADVEAVYAHARRREAGLFEVRGGLVSRL